MQKTMRKTLTIILCCFVMPAALAQHTLERLDMRVVLGKDGSASVTEWRQVEVSDEGTEGFITFNNMGGINVCNLQVSDETGVQYEVEEDWDVERSRAEKAGRCGYHEIRRGVELCWGLGDAGNRTYVIHYTLTNLVRAYTDYDGFCHSFYEVANAPAKEAHVEIMLEDDSLSIENAAVWAFGYYGVKGFDKGVCYATAEGKMAEGDAIIILLQLQKGLLDPVIKRETTFKETVKRKALEGSDYNLEDAGLGNEVSPLLLSNRDREDILALQDGAAPDTEDPDFGVLMGVLFIIGLAVLGAWANSIEKKRRKKEQQRIRSMIDTLMGGKKYDELPYYRDLPLAGNLLMSGAILGTLDTLISECGGARLGVEFRLQQLYDAFILRMIYKNQIKLQHKVVDGKTCTLFHILCPVKPAEGTDLTDFMGGKRKKRSELGENEATGISEMRNAKAQYKGFINDAGIEYYLQKLLYDAAGKDKLLQPNELKHYVKENPMEWRPFATILNLLTKETLDEKNLKQDEVQQVVGFLHYLRDFSLVAERGIAEMGLWKEYLVYASLYGIADQLRKDMKRVAPDAARLEKLVLPETLVSDILPLSIALASTVRYAHLYQTPDERRREESSRDREYSRSSGGSGSSSRSGGGGHSGGGGSGFR